MKSQHGHFEFTAISDADIAALTFVREGETKLGEKVAGSANGNFSLPVKYVILGVSEDIGPQSNGGFPGSVMAFPAFLKRFLNIQFNEFIAGAQIGILGEIKSLTDFSTLEQGRKTIEDLDAFAEQVLSPCVKQGMIPIMIGGGHNNAYPLISATGNGSPINVINLDPHADFRPLEGRHSGNPFSYAFDRGLIDKYTIIGLHQSYNSQFMLDKLRENDMDFTFFDDYLSGKSDFEQDLEQLLPKVQSKRFGIELDMDAIAYMPSSAFSPSGVTLEQARKYIVKCAASPRVAYLHLPEAAPKNPQEEAVVGKALAYLVADFVKANCGK